MAASKRILHLIDSGGLYGAEAVLLNLADRMARAAEFEPVVGCIVQHDDEPSDLFDEARRRGFAAAKLVMDNRLLARDVPRTGRRLRELGIDLIHSHGYKGTVYGSAAGRLAGVPLTATCHLWRVEPDAPLKMRVMIAIEQRLYRRFRRVVAVSEDIRSVLTGAGVAAERTRVIRNGIPLPDEPRPVDVRRRVRAGMQLPGDAFVVLNAGRLVEQKDQDTLIRAAARLRDDGVDVHVLIGGEGGLRDQLAARIAETGLEGRVRLLGFRDDMDDLLAACDVFALPSRDEGMPMILLEAVARRAPVVATAVGDVGKLIRDGDSGSIVPVENPGELAAALRAVAENPAAAADRADRAAEQLRREYSSEAMYQQYAEVYREYH